MKEISNKKIPIHSKDVQILKTINDVCRYTIHNDVTVIDKKNASHQNMELKCFVLNDWLWSRVRQRRRAGETFSLFKFI